MGKEDTVRKGVPGGYAPLGATGHMSVDYIGDFLITHRKLSRNHYGFTAAIYNCWAYDDILLPNPSLNAITINLTTAADYSQRILTIKAMSEAFAVTIQASGAETIDGLSSIVLQNTYEAIEIYSNGSNWRVLAKYRFTEYNDLVMPMIVRATGVGRPVLAAFVGVIQQYQFAIGDNAEIEAIELLHGWKEGTPIEVHVHWATGGLNDATVRGVNWEIKYSWANVLPAGGTTVFAAPTTVSVEDSIAAAEPDRTHRYTSVVTFTPTGGKIEAYLVMRVRRIASVTNPAPAADPFGLSVGVHYIVNSTGSSSISAK